MNALTPAAAIGLGLVLIYCVLATGADAITRIVAQQMAAPQLYFFSGLIVASLSFVTNAASASKGNLRSKRPRTLALRSALFIAASLCYFFAFKFLPFAEVFVFIALVPIFSALLSGPILRERVRWQSWIALMIGASGMVLLYPQGFASVGWAHGSALLGALCGSAAMVLARDISRDDPNALLQVLYPNLAMVAVMSVALPFMYRPMQPIDMAMVLAYGVLLFLARWVLVLALSRLKAYVVTLLINLQFVLMVIVGAVLFGEVPGLNLYLGAAVIILAGSYLFNEELLSKKLTRLKPRQARVAAARAPRFTTQGRMALTLKS